MIRIKQGQLHTPVGGRIRMHASEGPLTWRPDGGGVVEVRRDGKLLWVPLSSWVYLEVEVEEAAEAPARPPRVLRPPRAVRPPREESAPMPAPPRARPPRKE